MWLPICSFYTMNFWEPKGTFALLLTSVSGSMDYWFIIFLLLDYYLQYLFIYLLRISDLNGRNIQNLYSSQFFLACVLVQISFSGICIKIKYHDCREYFIKKTFLFLKTFTPSVVSNCCQDNGHIPYMAYKVLCDLASISLAFSHLPPVTLCFRHLK